MLKAKALLCGVTRSSVQASVVFPIPGKNMNGKLFNSREFSDGLNKEQKDNSFHNAQQSN